MNLKVVIITLLCFLALPASAQRYGKNYPDFERKKFHFGCHLGVTSSGYRYELKQGFTQFDSITQISVNRGPGFAIHLPLVSWNIHPTVHLRLLPSLTFHETVFDYTFLKNGRNENKITRTQPTLLNFPLVVKINTKRINNFVGYALGGFGYSYDLASQSDVDQTLGAPIVKLQKHDFQYHVGGGFDFFLPYFKFGLEIKLTNGVKNLLIQDETFFSAPLESLKSQVWWFSLTFEG